MDTKSITEIINTGLSLIAISVGGFWTYKLFIQHRQKYPRVEVKHEVIQKNLGNGKILFHVVIEVDNIGDVLLKLKTVKIRLLQVLPLFGRIKEAILNDDNPVNQDKTEIDWFQLFSKELLFSKEHTCEIEPKENESFHFDFVINDDIQTVMIYSFILNREKMRNKLGWQCATIHDIEGGTNKTENMEESGKKIVRPKPGEEETRQRKEKDESPIKGQVQEKPPSEEKTKSDQTKEIEQKKSDK